MTKWMVEIATSLCSSQWRSRKKTQIPLTPFAKGGNRLVFTYFHCHLVPRKQHEGLSWKYHQMNFPSMGEDQFLSLEGCRFLAGRVLFIRHSGLPPSSSPSPIKGEGTLSRHCETCFLRSWQSHDSYFIMCWIVVLKRMRFSRRPAANSGLLRITNRVVEIATSLRSSQWQNKNGHDKSCLII